MIGSAPVPGGFSIHKWNGSNWDVADGGAVRIAVEPGGTPWIVNDAGQILRRLSSLAGTVGWELKPGCAKDIGVGQSGGIWAIGCAAVPGGFSTHKWNGSNWEAADGGGSRIPVGPNNVPWIVNAGGTILRRLSSASGTVGWQTLPGCGRDIGISLGNYAWSIGCTAVAGGFNIQAWAEQPSAEGAPLSFKWVTLPGGATNISVGRRARPWVINNAGQIFRTFK